MWKVKVYRWWLVVGKVEESIGRKEKKWKNELMEIKVLHWKFRQVLLEKQLWLWLKLKVDSGSWRFTEGLADENCLWESYEEKRSMNHRFKLHRKMSDSFNRTSSTWPPSSNQVPFPSNFANIHQHLNRLSHSQYWRKTTPTLFDLPESQSVW
jgi:hypothetical protein